MSQCPINQLTSSEFGLLLFKRQNEDEVLSEAMSHGSLDGSHASLQVGCNSQSYGQMLGSSNQ